MIAIVISTYYRPDERSSFFLHRALNSIKSQTYKDYKIYLIGDNYTNKKEFEEIVSQYDVTAVDLERSIEREKYSFGDYRLFCSGGVTPYNFGIDLALKDGFKWICHLDHDDWWEPNHLQKISEVLKLDPLYVCTLATYYGAWHPKVEVSNKVYEYESNPGSSILSASCVKYSEVSIRFRDVFEETGKEYPADADFWSRLNPISRGRSYLISSITCHHDEEGYSIK